MSLRHRLGFIRAGPLAAPIRSCSRWGLPCRPRCRGRGALLPHHFTLACPWFPMRRRFVFCGTFPGVAPAGGWPAPYSRGARTFLHRGCAPAAAIRSSGGGEMRARGRGVNSRIGRPLCGVADPEDDHLIADDAQSAGLVQTTRINASLASASAERCQGPTTSRRASSSGPGSASNTGFVSSAAILASPVPQYGSRAARGAQAAPTDSPALLSFFALQRRCRLASVIRW